MDQLFNFGSSVAPRPASWTSPAARYDSRHGAGPDPLLAAFQATDPTTGKPYADDFGWLSHTYDTPYLDVGCATQDYIEAELNENTSSIAAAAGGDAGTGGLGLTESTDDSADAWRLRTPRSSCRATTPASPTWCRATRPRSTRPTSTTRPRVDRRAGTLAAGTYEYAVTDQFNGARTRRSSRRPTSTAP